VFDHTSVLKMIESVFNVPPLAARETSDDVGNLLSVIDLNNTPKSAPALPQPEAVTPQTDCASSINPGGLDEPNSFHRLALAATRLGWRVFP
jgi:hypothetical protein